MTRAYLPDRLEELMNRAIDQQVEGKKLDFKREISTKGEDFAELLKDLCAIANTDDPEHFHGLGYLLIGVSRGGTFHPLPANFDADSLSATLNQKVNQHIGPPLDLQVVGPLTHPSGQYAVVIVPDSAQQPHIIVKETGNAKPGQWWVRRGDTTMLAGPEEYARVLNKRVQREVQPLQEQLSRTRDLYENLEARLERLQVSTLQQGRATVADAADLSLAAKIRAEYGAADAPLRQALHREMLTFFDAFEAEFPTQAVERELHDPVKLKAKIARMEELTRPLGEALATGVMVGGGALDELVGQVLIKVTEKTLTFPQYKSLTSDIEILRSYPQVLLVLAVCAASLIASRTAWLRPVLKTRGRHFLQNYGDSELLDPTRKLVEWDVTFERLFPPDSCAPAYQHINDVVFGETGWLTGGDPFRLTPSLVAETEFLQSLIYIDGDQEWNTPIPNMVVYQFAADTILEQALRRVPGDFMAPLEGDLPSVIRKYLEGIVDYRGGASGRRMGCRRRISEQILKPFVE